MICKPGWNKNCRVPVTEPSNCHVQRVTSLANRLLEKLKKSFNRSSKVQQRGELETLALSFYSWFPKSNGELISDFEARLFVLSVFLFC